MTELKLLLKQNIDCLTGHSPFGLHTFCLNGSVNPSGFLLSEHFTRSYLLFSSPENSFLLTLGSVGYYSDEDHMDR